ncbi:MAG: hypothetical protein ABI810_21890 [Sphingomonas bacterium]
MALAISGQSAGAQDANHGVRSAYDYALRCFVAGGVAMPKPGVDPSGELTRTTRERARKSFDTAYLLGEKLGYSETKIAADLDHAQAVEMRLMIGSPAYFAATKADCVKLGLM